MRSGQPPAQVAVCTLLSRDLATALAAVPGVAMTGTLATANLGVEQIVVAVTERPWIRFLVVCGKDSPLFQAGQTLVALVRNGMRAGDHRVIDARGYLPLLRNVSPEQVRAFRCQVELVDARGEQDAGRL